MQVYWTSIRKRVGLWRPWKNLFLRTSFLGPLPCTPPQPNLVPKAILRRGEGEKSPGNEVGPSIGAKGEILRTRLCFFKSRQKENETKQRKSNNNKRKENYLRFCNKRKRNILKIILPGRRLTQAINGERGSYLWALVKTYSPGTSRSREFGRVQYLPNSSFVVQVLELRTLGLLRMGFLGSPHGCPTHPEDHKLSP